jgi:hypothetical protein
MVIALSTIKQMSPEEDEVIPQTPVGTSQRNPNGGKRKNS